MKAFNPDPLLPSTIPALPLVDDSVTIAAASGGYQQLHGETFYRIAHVDQMAPFFMSLISADDHWMFIASNGALTCGRKFANRALFPYYSSDKLLDMSRATGPVTIIQREMDGAKWNWEPFSDSASLFEIDRAIYKNRFGSRLCFEETNLSWGVTFRYQWALSERYGFIRSAELLNLNATPQSFNVLDGLRNLLPSGLDHNFQLRFSNLADAYKKSELLDGGRLAVYYLSSIPTDRAEPSEGLRATVVWQRGAENAQILLSERQVAQFRKGRELEVETDIRGQRGAFLLVKRQVLAAHAVASWDIVADVHLDHCGLVGLRQELLNGNRGSQLRVQKEIQANDQALMRLVSRVDGIQVCRDSRRVNRHLANSLFNIMRGGIPVQGYGIQMNEFAAHVRMVNRDVHARLHTYLETAQPLMNCNEFVRGVRETGDLDLIRIAREYLPLTFSRRHGDPTRPWNAFHIDIKNSDGSRRLGYEGNWRDIFQNWEALSKSYPLFLPAMIHRFLNASTIDGYNPYRITQNRLEWESPDPSDPWANIGYWGDHQIVYLQKLLEQCRAYSPTALDDDLQTEINVYADVPYRLREYASIRNNPRETIDFDWDAARRVDAQVANLGSDGQLVKNQTGEIHKVNLLEKLLLPAAIKIANLIPDAGIWLNTQRPEWNDAHNALVGNGASVVTACYLRRYCMFLQHWLQKSDLVEFKLSIEVADLIQQLSTCLHEYPHDRPRLIDDLERHQIVERLQIVGETYRRRVYRGLLGTKTNVRTAEILVFLQQCIDSLTPLIHNNRRDDGLYHAYNLLAFSPNAIRIERLEEMLEGQVAVLEANLLRPSAAADLLARLRNSRLYREDQQSYLLYPNRVLPRFDEKNRVDKALAESIPLVRMLTDSGDGSVLQKDLAGEYHFNGDLRNQSELQMALDRLAHFRPEWRECIRMDLSRLLNLYEETFQHRRFTGRSSTFFAYEGLGSIYWHMVSKLALAAGRMCITAHDQRDPAFQILLQQFREINEGIWLNKSPAVFGAFPTDPYSHTPLHAGAQQPGMTGQVKEDILIRWLELGIRVAGGRLVFSPVLLDSSEFLQAPSELKYVDVNGETRSEPLDVGSLGFTVCQVPIVMRYGTTQKIRIIKNDGQVLSRNQCELTWEESQAIFSREGQFQKIEIECECQ